MSIVSHLASLATLALTLSTALSSPNANYGSWNVNVTSGNAASGYRWADIYAEYSGVLGTTNHCHWLYSPAARNTTLTCDQTDFTATWGDGQGNIRKC
jgi:hypothetical protein